MKTQKLTSCYSFVNCVVVILVNFLDFVICILLCSRFVAFPFSLSLFSFFVFANDGEGGQPPLAIPVAPPLYQSYNQQSKKTKTDLCKK